MLEKILQNIDEKVDKDLESIKEERKKKLKELEKDYDKKIKEKKEEKKEAFKREAEEKIDSYNEEKRREAKFEIQKEKREILSELYEKGEEEIADLSQERLKKVIKSFLPKEIEGEIKAGEKTARVLRDLTDAKVSSDLNEEGFIIKGDKKELDSRISEMIKASKEKVEPKITDLLFPENLTEKIKENA